MSNKLEKLKQLMALMQNDTITPAQLKGFLEMVLSTIQKSKDNLEDISNQNIKELKQALAYIQQVHSESAQDLEEKKSKAFLVFDAKIKEAQSLIKELKSIKVKDGENGKDGIDGLNGKDGENGKDGSPDTGEEIADKLESLEGEARLDAKAIKNLEDYLKSSEVVKVISGGGSNLKVKNNGALVGSGTAIDFRGSAISSITHNGNTAVVTINNQSLAGYVPYTGADDDVDLGTFNLSTTGQLNAGNLRLTGNTLSSVTGALNLTSNDAQNINIAPAGAGILELEAGSGGIAISTTSGNSDITLTPHGTGQVLNPSGTASLPGIGFTDDPDTGFFRNSTGTVGYSGNGVSRFTFNTLGLTSTGSGFHIARNHSEALPTYAINGDTDTGMGTSAPNTLSWSTGGTYRMYLDSTGLGIGVTPSSKFHVEGNTIISGNGTLLVGAVGSNLSVLSTTPRIQATTTSGIAVSSVGVGDGTNNNRLGIYVDHTSREQGIAWTRSSGAIPFFIKDVSTNRMLIDISGNIGFGTGTATTAPRKVTINSDTDASLYIRRNSTTTGHYAEILFQTSTADLYATGIRSQRVAAGFSDLLFMGQQTAGSAYATLYEMGRFTAGGDFGLGTGATVSAKLHVLDTTEQLRIGYDAANYLSITVSSAGIPTFTPTGSEVTFSNTGVASDFIHRIVAGNGSEAYLELWGDRGDENGDKWQIGANNATSAANELLLFRSFSSGAWNTVATINSAGEFQTDGGAAFGVNTASAKVHVVSTTEQLRLGYDASNYTSFTVNSAGALNISPTGAGVGIGTSTPFSRLELYTNDATAVIGKSAGSLTLRNVESTNAVGSRGFVGINFTASNTTDTGRYAGIYGVVTGSGGAGQIGDIVFGGKTLISTTTLTEYARLTSTGNFGIGVTPQTQLDVNGRIFVRAQGTAPTSGAGTYLNFVGSGATGRGWIQTYDYSASTARDLRLQAVGGNVVIGGDTEAQAKLDVSGSILAENSTFPVLGFTRNTTLTGGAFDTTTGVGSSMKLQTATSDDMTDGFGGGIVMYIKDNTFTPSDAQGVARLYARRDGLDNAGMFQIGVGTNGNNFAFNLRASGYLGLGTTNPAHQIDVNLSSSSTGVSSSNFQRTIPSGTISSGSSINASIGQLVVAGSTTISTITATGGNFIASHGGSSTVHALIGLRGQARTNGASTGVLTDAISVLAVAPNNNQVGNTITNAYSLYIESPSAGTSLNYGLYQAGSALNYFGGVVQHNAPVRLKGYTVAGLPSGTQGDRAFVTDATLPVYGAALTGGGAVVVPVFYNGTIWISA